MDVAVVLFIVDQTEVKVEGANERIREYLLSIIHLDFCDIVKHLIRTLSKVKEENLIE